MRHLSAVELAEWLAEFPDDDTGAPTGSSQRQRPLLLDVREPWEYAICRLAGSQPLPMSALPSNLDRLDRQAETVVICHHGIRSLQVAHFLERKGFASVYNLSGGIDAWADDVDPLMRKY
ncbi:MAG TPA: rhodanese-like domain-containing protein [Accumulibacter sp.]|nr:rhodanese-like domain-containing protein [Accumulibacter sp.]